MARPTDYIPQEVYSWEQLNAELRRLSLWMQEMPVHALAPSVWHAEPERPYEGMLVIADGTDWDPGSGMGYYWWDGATWSFLG